MKNVGFLGCGKIGKHMLNDLLEGGVHKVTFVQDPFYEAEEEHQQFYKKDPKRMEFEEAQGRKQFIEKNWGI